MAQNDSLGYLALAALVASAVYFWRRGRNAGQDGDGPAHSAPPDDQDENPKVAETEPSAGGKSLSTRPSESADQIATAPGGQDAIGPAAGRPLRRLDIVTLRCEHLDHPAAGHVPTATLELEWISRDLRNLRRLGWGGDSHVNVCRYHNREGHVDLDVIHVLCDTCPEREVIRTAKTTWSELSRLAGNGWRNHADNTIACPYCTGIRQRPWW